MSKFYGELRIPRLAKPRATAFKWILCVNALTADPLFIPVNLVGLLTSRATTPAKSAKLLGPAPRRAVGSEPES